ncbi:hypothetical protein AMTRI_Chr10g230360 [Amborella trichopoda]|uniref:WRKY domain-containing protein n=1 Tax=Amborella trichopoda TaxID=13333 RepID=W1NWG1_AMBTC|nr:WRKY transcription factor SUSIBA2 [Amborella trichopoda]ERM99620.1 hypothetical protein AMTR_s00088p00164440 [Amborella trichopoda]|eukprot:XP_006836767.1 WRKY transcription factor SUSIBA2 [Amborella trichopoda]
MATHLEQEREREDEGERSPSSEPEEQSHHREDKKEEREEERDGNLQRVGHGGLGSRGLGGLSTARYKALSPANLPIGRSSCPPILSPSAMLDSPVLLSNMQHAEPSPTTGSFMLPPFLYNAVKPDPGSSKPDDSKPCHDEDGGSAWFVFKPHIKSGQPSLGDLASSSTNYQQCEKLSQVQTQSLTSSVDVTSAKNEHVALTEHELSLSITSPTLPSHMASSQVNGSNGVSSEELQARQCSSSGIQKGSSPLTVVERSSEDGFNWRKYGQKQVKGSEFPRSYYKCTYPNCQVKKIMERSLDGRITDINYKGQHDHPKPQPSRRLAVGSVQAIQEGEERSELFRSSINAEDKSSNAQGQFCNYMDPNGTPELSSVSASEDDTESGSVQANKTRDEVEDDDPESKRRKREFSAVDSALLCRSTREPRVVVQTTSEVDILDDGYRWRKYGQKVVKGNPNPRSYYKCTNAGCPVRKHVERASHDPKSVITTYEGKHNHDVPSGRANTSENTFSAISHSPPTPNSHPLAPQNLILGPTTTNQAEGTKISYYDHSVSLDLGVGVGPGLDNRYLEKLRTLDSATSSIQIDGLEVGKVIQATPISSLQGGGSEVREGEPHNAVEKRKSFTFETPKPVYEASGPYYQSMGRLLLGP